MLLNPNDFTYEYFHQKRGRDGDSGPLYYGKPKASGLCPILVKSINPVDAINEFLGCNIGRRIGVYTPQAWLFKPVIAEFDKIHFGMAVAIEFLEGLVDMSDREDSYYSNDELAKQAINGILLHKLMFDRDGVSLGRQGGRIVAFDFAEGMLTDFIYEKTDGTRNRNGFTKYEWMVLSWQIGSRKEMLDYLRKLDKEGRYNEFVESVYMDFRSRFLGQYKINRFSDLISEIENAFNPRAGDLAKDMIDSMQQAIVSF